jgi:hypothetical protein
MNDYEAKRKARIDRLRARAGSTRQTSEALFNESHRMADAIPFGQPILVGHHSEGRDRRYRSRMAGKMDKACAASKRADRLEQRATAAENNHAISSDDPEAVVKLKEKIADMEAEQRRMKAVNTAHRKFLKDPSYMDTELSESDAQLVRQYEPTYSWTPHPFPPYELTNNNANIRRCKERLTRLEKETEQANQPAAEPITGDGWRIEEHPEENRIWFVFDAKPPKETCKLMRTNGFNWSRQRGAWVRMLANGRWAAESVGKQLSAG